MMSIFKKVIAGWDKVIKKQQREFVDRQPRFSIRPLHRVVFHCQLENKRHLLTVSNISKSGIGLLRRQFHDVEIGTTLQGEVEINGNGFPIEALVRHRTESVIGCQFKGSLSELSQAVHEYFRIEILALMLNPVSEAYLKPVSSGRAAWFTDGQHNELYFVFDDRGILKFHLSFLGNYIEGGREDRVRCGYIIEDSSAGMNKYKGPPILDLKDSASAEMLQLGELLIDGIQKLPPDQAHALKALLQKG
jgi:hypothetical protein